jgi:hypothetical protein
MPLDLTSHSSELNLYKSARILKRGYEISRLALARGSKPDANAYRLIERNPNSDSRQTVVNGSRRFLVQSLLSVVVFLCC